MQDAGRAPPRLLAATDPHPVRVTNPEGAGPFVLVSDHAGRRRPAALGDLGVPAGEWDRHIARDIGIKGVGAALARLLDAPLVEQRYSRLVIDCNRAPGHPASVPVASEATPVPGNEGLAPDAVPAREREILAPYHAAIGAMLDRRAGRRTVLVALHSFTPVFLGVPRRWEAAVLHGENGGYARALLARMRADGCAAGDNEPYALTALSDYTIPLHAWRRGLDHVELEIRQDGIATTRGQAEWAARFASWLLAHEAEWVPGGAERE